MSQWLIALEGTQAGHQLALFLAISAAILHAVFGAMQKGRYDPWVMRGAIDISYFLMAAPFALFVVPWPEPHMWRIFAGVFVIHLIYKLLQALAYERGAYTVVYPVVRGMGPLFTVIFAGFVFKETYTLTQWLGVFTLVSGIFGLAVYNYIMTLNDRRGLLGALGFAVLTGAMVAVYTTYDAWGIRATADPFTFLAWFFMLDGLAMPYFGYRRWRAMSPSVPVLPLMRRGIVGALVAFASFGAIMLATRIGKVGEAAVLRETSVIFAAVIGVVFLRETVGPRRIFLMALIALGAIIVETGG